MTARACPFCGVEMANPRRVQCGAVECRRRWQAERTAEWLRQRPGYRDRYRWDAECMDCGVALRVNRVDHRRCGTCARRAAGRVGAAANAERARARRLPVPYAGPPLPPPAARVTPAPVYVMGWCASCGTAFVDRQLLARFCSALCARRAGKDRRRARKREAYVADVNRRAVFERDRWTCRLCGKRVARSKAVPHPKAPVLDHVVPLAAGVEFGGVHAPHNVQTAHFLCNSLKRDLLAQAALF